ncbi:MAG: glycosyltransferase family 39 protein [Eubacteriales bacterium]|nr:glycosyltransferase family 39 protein [Eubacteriales bacterium]
MLKRYDRLSTDEICLVILMVGFFLRMIYAIRVGYDYSPHDLGVLTSPGKEGFGHLAYIQYLYENHAFASVYMGQFYHPPLFYIAGAMLAALFRVRMDYAPAFEALQQLNMAMSCVGTYYAYKIAGKVCRNDRFLIAAAIYLAFCPAFYVIGAELNSDCFVTVFQIMAVYYTIVWLEESTVRNILRIAVCIILAMLSKTSGVIIAGAIGCCFLWRIIDRKSEWKNLLKQYAVFGAVSIPLGLSWEIRKVLVLGAPLGYIMRLPVTHQQYVGDLSLGERLAFPYHLGLCYQSIDFSDPAYHCNIWTQMFYTMNYDENLILGTSGAASLFFYRLLFYVSIVLYIMLADMLIRALFDKSICMGLRLAVCLNYLIYLAFFIVFSFNYPHICSMNFRYIVLTAVLLILGYGLYYSRHYDKRILNNAVLILIAVQSISASMLYLIWPRI